jgi:predicted transcriptional regulator
MRKHLAILTRPAIKSVIAGEKTIEIRFSKKRISPFGEVGMGDIVYMKPPGEELIGQFEIKKVISLEGIEESEWEWIKTEFGPKMGLGSPAEAKNYFKLHQGSKYATIMFISKVEQFITSPIRIIKRDLRGWLVINESVHIE